MGALGDRDRIENELRQIRESFLNIAARSRDLIHSTRGEEAEGELAELQLQRQRLGARYRELVLEVCEKVTTSAAA